MNDHASPKSMRALAVFPKKKEIRLIETKTPKIMRPDQVMLHMHDVGLCGTDREICSFEYGTPPEGSDHLVIGHESLGEVIGVGANVTRVKVGDLAVLTVRRPCLHKDCIPCRSGYSDFCITGDYTERGIKGAHGFMAEYVVDQEMYIHRVPRNLREVAVLTEPLTVAEKALDQSRDIVRRLPWMDNAAPKNSRLLLLTSVVLGAGAVGLLGAMTLIAAGSVTYVYSRDPAPNPSSEFVESIGGKYYSEGRIPQEARKALFGKIHLIYEATGASRLAFNVLKILGHNSEFILTGVPSLKGPFEIDGDLLMRNIVLKNQVIFGTVNASPQNFDEAILDLNIFNKRWPKALRSLITSSVSLEEAVAVLSPNSTSKGIKTVIRIDSSNTPEGQSE